MTASITTPCIANVSEKIIAPKFMFAAGKNMKCIMSNCTTIGVPRKTATYRSTTFCNTITTGFL